MGPIRDLTVLLGGTAESADVTLDVASAHFLNNQMFVRGGEPGEPLKARLLSSGTTLFEGELSVEAFGGQLIINAQSDGDLSNFILDNTSGKTRVLVTQESSLVFRGEQITNDAVVEVEGTAKIAAGVDFGGNGMIELNSGGHLIVKGSVGSDQVVAMVDGKTTLTLSDPDTFHAGIGLAVSNTAGAVVAYGGQTIDLDDMDARSASYDEGILTLYSRGAEKGKVVAELAVHVIDAEGLGPLPPHQQTLTAKDFTLSDDGDGGTRIALTPEGPTFLEASLPVTVVAETNSTISLETILMQSFGTPTPDFYGMVLIPAQTDGDSNPESYWGQPPHGEAVKPVWLVNGQPIDKPTTITANDQVELLVGNKIAFPPQIQVQLTEAATGKKTEYVTYDVWSTDPKVAEFVQGQNYTPGKPAPAEVVAAAHAYDTVFHNVLSSDLCNWIGDDVAAAAGATMPLPDAQPDPSENVSGGFWRVVYRGSDQDEPPQDWSTLVQAGDIVRMQWLIGGAHTTTVLGVNDNGTITVYDNANVVDGKHTIGVHDAQYWKETNPAGITIYRLDSDQQYLTKGTDLSEYLHGTVFDDLIRARGGDDIVIGGIGDDELKGSAGADQIFGGEGNDMLNGGEGKNELTGGAGADSLRFAAKLKPGNLGIITDFAPGEDVIQLDKSIFKKIGGEGPLEAKFFEVIDKSDDGKSRILYDQDDGTLYYNNDGDSGPVKFAKVEAGLALDHSDFFVV